MTTPPVPRSTSTPMGDQATIGVIVTGVLVLSAPTTLQVIWLIAVALITIVVARRNRASPLDPSQSDRR